MTLLSNNNQKDWMMIQISDTHLMNKDELEFVHMNPAETFYAVMDDVQTRYPEADFIVHTGDLAQVAAPETYEHYLSYIQQFNIPSYQIPGNHDDANIFPFHNGTNDAHAVHFGQWTIILLNSAVKNKVSGFIDLKQLQQLNELLTQYKDQHVIVTCHHHPFEMHSQWIDHHILKNADHLMGVLAKHQNIKMVLFGHVHQDSWNQWNGIHFYSTPSTCVQFKPQSENFALDEQAPGYRVLHLKENGEFETEIHRINHKTVKINSNISGY